MKISNSQNIDLGLDFLYMIGDAVQCRRNIAEGDDLLDD